MSKELQWEASVKRRSEEQCQDDEGRFGTIHDSTVVPMGRCLLCVRKRGSQFELYDKRRDMYQRLPEDIKKEWSGNGVVTQDMHM